MTGMRTFIPATLLTSLLIGASGRAAMITQMTSFGPSNTNFSNQALSPTLLQFNPSLGTLNSVVITASSSIIATLSGTFTTGNSAGTYSVTLGSFLGNPSSTSVTGPGISGVSNSTTSDTFFSVSIPANTIQPISFGPSAVLTAPASPPATFTLTPGDGANFTQFIGAGSLANYLTSATANASDSFSGGGNFNDQVTIATQGSASVTVVYNFTQAVPEPTSLLLLSGLSMGLASFGGYRKLRARVLGRNAGTESSPG